MPAQVATPEGIRTGPATAASAVALAVVALVRPWEHGWAAPFLVLLVALSGVLTYTDVSEHRLPNAVVLPAYPLTLALLGLASWAPGSAEEAWGSLLRASAGGACLYAFYFVLAVVHPGAMGFGDVKLAGLLGAVMAWFGWPHLAVGVVAAFVVAAFVAAPLALCRGGRGVPFGPWMLIGAAAGVGLGTQVWAWYAHLLG